MTTPISQDRWSAARGPRRIVCLTPESAEILYALGAGERVVGVSGYTVQPPEARRKPKVGAYTTVDFDRVMGLDPDLVVAYSDLQADITAALARRGATVLHLNQRTFDGLCHAVELLGGVVGEPAAAAKLIGLIRGECASASRAARALPRRPRVYFEEWDDPLIAGIGWVSEAVAIAGGEDVFADLNRTGAAKDRVVSADDVRRRNPDIVFASWCGKKVRPERIASRPGWRDIAAVRDGHVYEIKSAYILQPGPSVLTGVRQMAERIAAWSAAASGAARPS
ncbi:MAG TPA: cobalamin-binding protein [Nitrospiria bacterium]|nr:cobalamin-binding protein [Nitrospiria bacterium]